MNILGITAFSLYYVNHKYIDEVMKIRELSKYLNISLVLNILSLWTVEGSGKPKLRAKLYFQQID